MTNKEIREWARASLIESGLDSAKIILTESMGGDSTNLKKSFENLAKAYSLDVKESTVVILTKSNLAPASNFDDKFDYAKKLCQ
jgi:hypothetical protein